MWLLMVWGPHSVKPKYTCSLYHTCPLVHHCNNTDMPVHAHTLSLLHVTDEHTHTLSLSYTSQMNTHTHSLPLLYVRLTHTHTHTHSLSLPLSYTHTHIHRKKNMSWKPIHMLTKTHKNKNWESNLLSES